MDLARPVIEQRMQKYQAGEVHFNLMAMVQDKLVKWNKEIAAATEAGKQSETVELQMKVQEEQERRKKWHLENVRRRHNYLPFIVELIKELAKEEKLTGVYEKAKEKAVEADKRKKELKDQKAQAAAASASPALKKWGKIIIYY